MILLVACVLLSKEDYEARFDRDGDGYANDDLLGDDCDDDDPDIHPGAVESCDEVDQDCDGEKDEDATDALPFWPDVDRDGFGDALQEVRLCEPEVGYLPADPGAEDCDDLEEAVNPDATEVCNEVDDDCDGDVDVGAEDALPRYADADGDGFGDASSPAALCAEKDGYVVDATDCDDSAADVYPDAPEWCDGVDHDCDEATFEETSEDAGTWYVDGDGDTFGAGDPVRACEAPEGTVPTAGDCDDGAAAVSPAATEACNGVDDDCEGGIDEDAPEAPAWYADTDGDGFGDSAVVAYACEAPEAHVALGTDCDDTRAAANPAGTETCDAGDEDCDGLEDDADPSVTGRTPWYEDLDGDGYGDVALGDTCVAPVGGTATAGDCDDTLVDVNPAAAETCNDGLDNDCDGTHACGLSGDQVLADADLVLAGSATAGAPGAALAAGDHDADGVLDLLVGDPDDTLGGTGSGVGLFLAGPLAGDLTSAVAWVPRDPDGEVGAAVGQLGDVDGDGVEDFALGGPGAAADAGLVFVVLGPVTGSGPPAGVWDGGTAGDRAGEALAGGDLSGDGHADLAVAAPETSQGGSVYLLTAPTEMGDLGDAPLRFDGEGAGWSTGAALARAVDWDGDGLDELWVGAPGVESGTTGGVVFRVDAATTGTISVRAGALGSIEGATADGQFGAALAAGDVQGDGYGDLLVGAPGAQGAWFFLGSAREELGPLPAGAADATFAEAATSFGQAVALLGDTDDDGFRELAIGAPDGDGAVWVYPGPFVGTPAAVATLTGSAGSGLGAALADLGDQDGDGYDDVAVGAPGALALYVWFGGEE